jgi:hypothetical protein
MKTVELIVEAVPWRPRPRHPRRRDEIVAVGIAFQETELRERAKRLGGVWRPAQKLWEITGRDAKRLPLPTGFKSQTFSETIYCRTYAGIFPFADGCIHL